MIRNIFSCLLICLLLACTFPLVSLASPVISYTDLPSCSLQIVSMQSQAAAQARAAFTKDYPQVTLNDATTYFLTDAAYISYLLTQDSNVDIYCLPVNIGVGNLKDKGYLPSLESPISNEMVSSYYPQLKELLTIRGDVVAAPAEFAVLPWYRNTVLWDQVNAGPVPSTYIEYAKLVRWWEDEHMDNGEFTLCINSQTRDNMLEEMLRIFLLQSERPDTPVNFDTSSFRMTLMAVADMPILQKRDDPNDEWLNEMINLPSLIDQGHSAMGQSSSAPDWSLMTPLVVDETLPPALPVQMNLYVLNPYSKNLSAARKYLEYVLAYLPSAYNIQFCPDENTPLQDPEWERVKESLQEKIAWYQKQLEAGDPSEAKGMKEQIASIQQRIDSEDGRMLISQKDIHEYREIAPFMKFGEYSVILNYDDAVAFKELLAIAKRYCDGYLDMESAIRSLNDKANAVYLEAN